MQLIMSPVSPYVRKVRVLVREAGLEDRITETPVTTSPLDSAALAVSANPLGRIPALVRDDGPALYDSRVICRYLDSLSDTVFYPEPRLWEVLTLEATAEGLLDSAVAMTYELRFRGDAVWTDWLDAQWAKIKRALDALEDRWISHLTGQLNMGHIATACALDYLDLRHDDRGWRDGRPALCAFQARFSERDSMRKTAPA
jgi:glutathione S-transferase